MLRTSLPTGWRDARVFPFVAAPVVATLGVVEAATDPEYRLTFGVLAAVAVWLGVGMLAQAVSPAIGLVLVSTFYPLTIGLDAPGPGGTGLIAVLLAAGYAGQAEPARRSLLATTGAVVVFVGSDVLAHGLAWDSIFFPAIFYPARWMGVLVRRERDRAAELLRLTAELEARRDADAAAAAAEERARVAREVHDAVAHSVSVMTLQLGGLRRQLDGVLAGRDAEREVMLGLERLGRQTVDELRALVGILRAAPTANLEDDEAGLAASVPTLARAAAVVDDVRAAGLDVSLTVSGEPRELPRALDASAFRILQEALTNVLRHAPGSHADVEVAWTPSAVHLVVRDDGGSGARRLGRGGGGHGLVGMRERAALFGGRLEAGPSGRGWQVRAHLPTTGLAGTVTLGGARVEPVS